MICLNIDQAIELRNGHDLLKKRKIKIYIDNSILRNQAIIIWKGYNKLATRFDEHGTETPAWMHSHKNKRRGDENL